MKAPTIEERHRVVAAELKALDDRIADLQRDHAQSQADFEQWCAVSHNRSAPELIELNERVSEMGGRLGALKGQRAQLATTLAGLTAAIAAPAELQRTSTRLRAIAGELVGHRTMIGKLDAAIAAARVEHGELEAKAADQARAQAAASLEARLAGSAAPTVPAAPDAGHRRAVLEQEIAVATTRRAELEAAIASLQTEERELRSAWRMIRTQVAETAWQAAVESIHAAAADLVALRGDLELRIAVPEDLVDAATARLEAERLAQPRGRA